MSHYAKVRDETIWRHITNRMHTIMSIEHMLALHLRKIRSLWDFHYDLICFNPNRGERANIVELWSHASYGKILFIEQTAVDIMAR